MKTKKHLMKSIMTSIFALALVIGMIPIMPTDVNVSAKGTVVELTSETGEVTLNDGDVLKGTGGTETHVTIAAGATVTLNGVIIENIKDDKSHKWAGLSCEGDAIIILAENTTNSVRGGYEDYPGIYIPKDNTLTIQGKGFLKASNNGYASGIGGGYEDDCGNIVIKSGNITAIGNASGAGIGGYKEKTCGNIIIEDGVSYVKALQGYNATNSIGTGTRGTCGSITIFGIPTQSIKGDYIYDPSIKYTIKFNSTGGVGSMSDLTLSLGELKKLPKCDFTNTGKVFAGWSTTAGGNAEYVTGQVVMNLSTTDNDIFPLYAVWDDYNVTLTSSTGNVRLFDGQILTGKGGEDTHVTIVDGATVYLSGVDITSIK